MLQAWWKGAFVVPIDYLSILVLLAVATAVAVIAILVSAIAGPHKPSPDELSPYESGMPPVGNARLRF